jgi:outer membrane protein assembly factor BamB
MNRACFSQNTPLHKQIQHASCTRPMKNNFVPMKILIPILLTVIISSNLAAQDIAQWRGDNRDGIYNETGLLKKWPDEGPKLLWHFDELGDGHTSAAVTATTVYTSGMIGDKGFVFAIDHSGKLLWKTEYGTEWTENWNGVRSTPLVYKDKLYVLSSFGKLVCMDSKTGKILWNKDMFKDYDGQNIIWGITENLLIDENKIFCTSGGMDANVIALNRDNGQLIWKSKGNGEKSAYNSPCLISLPKRKIIVTMTEKSILGIDASNGNLLWKQPQTNKWAVHANTAVYKNGFLYCVTGYGAGGAMFKLSPDGESITEVWRDSWLDPKTGGVVVLNDRIYGTGDRNKKLFCLDWNTGKTVYSSGIMAPGNIIAADGLLYCYSEAGRVGLVEAKADSFNLISSFKVPFGANQHWAHLVIHNKRLYVRHGTSLMVYDIAEK